VKFTVCFWFIAAALLGIGLLHRGWWLTLLWLAMNFLVLGYAYGAGRHWIFGKRPDGTLPWWTQVIFFPFLFLTQFTRWLLVALSREPAFNRVNDHLTLGRRLASTESCEAVTHFVDLTAEFTEPAPFRTRAGYVSFPILDGSAPCPRRLKAFVESLGAHAAYVHCAQGYGRAALVALAILLQTRGATTVEDGLARLREVRPRIRLSAAQRACIDEFSRLLT
jgi:protein-tyrosine phosphatase